MKLHLTGGFVVAGFVGQNTDIDASAEALGSSQTIVYGVQIKALTDNTDKIYVGLSDGVTAGNGYELDPGQSVFIPVALASNVAGIYVIAGDVNQGVCYIGA